MVDIVAAYAATISTIKTWNFIDFIIIQFYNNFKKLWKQLNEELSELPEDDPQGVETCRSKCSYIRDWYLCNMLVKIQCIRWYKLIKAIYLFVNAANPLEQKQIFFHG